MEALDKAITAAGNTASDLAKVLGIDKSNVSHWRAGRKPVPYRHRIKLFELYGIRPSEFEAKQ